MWNHIPPDEVARKTRNYGLAGGWLTPPAAMTCPLCGGEGVLSLASPSKQAESEDR